MLQFTSALYLGLDHSSGTLRPWCNLTTGSPAALGVLPGEAALAADLARLVGCESAVLAPATLHIFWDLFCVWGRERVSIYVDDGAYPVGRWGVRRMAAQGVPACEFAHRDPRSLERKLRAAGARARRPIVLADGFCPQCGEHVPLAEYAALVRRWGGWLVVDDTQSLGIFGAKPAPAAPYGRGGGGSLRFCGLEGPDIVVVGSMAKAFGTPMAFVAGSREIIRSYEMASETRVYTSPVSAADISAGEQAVLFNERQGDATRRRLAHLVRSFQEQAAAEGWKPLGGRFPLQAFPVAKEGDALAISGALLRQGVETVLQAAAHDGRRRVAFLITARHSPLDIARAAEAWTRAVMTLPGFHRAPRGGKQVWNRSSF